jgi:hypothetical protein
VNQSTNSKRRIPLALWVALSLLLGILGGFVILTAFSCDSGFDAKKCKAQLECQSLATAIEAYGNDPKNTKEELPRTPTDLVQPPWGGSSFLRDGERDLQDPWGNPYQFERVTRKDGTEYILVKTTTPDGTPISQFGIGEKNAAPRP